MGELCVQGAPKPRQYLHSGLSYKRLSSGHFAFWPDGVNPVRAFEAYELQVLLMGGDPTRARVPPPWRRLPVPQDLPQPLPASVAR
jgi:hypothetical protein